VKPHTVSGMIQSKTNSSLVNFAELISRFLERSAANRAAAFRENHSRERIKSVTPKPPHYQ
jgi:hypothetical protein